MKKYFESNVEDAVRITVVEDDDDFQTEGEEIFADDLPSDFANWKIYTHIAPGVATYSRYGD